MAQRIHQCGGLADLTRIVDSSTQVRERGRRIANNP